MAATYLSEQNPEDYPASNFCVSGISFFIGAKEGIPLHNCPVFIFV
ncbi:MAG: hypothetical protein R6U85_10365 [Salinivirgaceae bacterium]